MMKSHSEVFFDIECYQNYFLVLFKGLNNKVFKVSMFNDKVRGNKDLIYRVFKRHLLVSFNGNNYDIPMVAAFLHGFNNAELKAFSDKLIKSNRPVRQLLGDVVLPKTDHIDLVGVTPLQSSLKTYGCRIHAPKLQDLPIDPSALIDEKQIILMEHYCENDTDVTRQIYEKMSPDIELRIAMGAIYEQDLRSLSAPQIAERAIRHRLVADGHSADKRDGEVQPFQYQPREFIKFKSPELSELFDTVKKVTFTVNDSGKVNLPDELKKVITYDGAKYKLGIGGLHSQEKCQAIVPTENQLFGEFDVASMYPSIILEQGIYPTHLDKDFVRIYRDIFNERIEAKRNGNKVVADSLKLVLNSSYGKFGSPYSFLYSPELLIQTTVTGQLALLMLIERLTTAGCKVVSANTDGVNVLMDKSLWDTALSITEQWTKDTTYLLEWTPYSATYSESVNSYIALKPDGGVKTKGVYESGSIGKGYSNKICVDAVIEYLLNGTPIATTIGTHGDVRDFLTMRGVKGGAVWRNRDLGRVVRWYVGVDGEPITYKSNGNKVAGSDWAVPMMNLSELPTDIDYQWYINKAETMMEKLGVK